MYDREQGVRAIIELQAIAGIDEPRDKAERGWDAMSDRDLRNTEAAHKVFTGGFKDALTNTPASA